MNDLAKMLIIAGAGIILLGVILYALGKIPGMGRLPGDIMIKKENFTFYFPLATCLILSLVVSLILFLWNRR